MCLSHSGHWTPKDAHWLLCYISNKILLYCACYKTHHQYSFSQDIVAWFSVESWFGLMSRGGGVSSNYWVISLSVYWTDRKRESFCIWYCVCYSPSVMLVGPFIAIEKTFWRRSIFLDPESNMRALQFGIRRTVTVGVWSGSVRVPLDLDYKNICFVWSSASDPKNMLATF